MHASTPLCLQKGCHAHTNFVSQHPLQPVLSRSGDIDGESGAAVHHGHGGSRQQVLREMDHNLKRREFRQSWRSSLLAPVPAFSSGPSIISLLFGPLPSITLSCDQQSLEGLCWLSLSYSPVLQTEPQTSVGWVRVKPDQHETEKFNTATLARLRGQGATACRIN